MRFGILVALGLVFAAGLGIAKHLTAPDVPPPARIDAGVGSGPTPRDQRARRPRKRARTRSTTRTTTGGHTRGAMIVGEDHRGRGRGGIDEAEVDSHPNRSGSNNASSGGGDSGRDD